MSKVDFHIHTKFSDDGEFSPGEIVRQCEAEGMEWIAVTDHNSVRGVPKAMEEAVSVRVISGVELDCVYRGHNFHLLGYGINAAREEFWEIEQDILSQERRAAEEKIRLFSKASGIYVDADKILAESESGVVTGEQIAAYVLGREDAERDERLVPYLPGGQKSDMPNVRFYWDFFSKGKPAYVEISYLSLPDAAALIHSAGGMAVLAHPGQNLKGDDELLDRMTGLRHFLLITAGQKRRIIWKLPYRVVFLLPAAVIFMADISQISGWEVTTPCGVTKNSCQK